MTAHILKPTLAVLLAAGVATPGCAALRRPAPRPPAAPSPALTAATPAPLPSAPVQVVAIPMPLPLPGQLKPLDAPGSPPSPNRAPTAPIDRVSAANATARIEPVRAGFINAMQRYPFTEGALYQVYTAPGQVTDIALEPGELLVGAGPVAAGDTTRWIIGDTESGSGGAKRVHVLVKPTSRELVTNLIINTDRRTYHLELRATASAYMAEVSWTYPQDALIALRGRAAEAAAAAPVATGLDLTALRFSYRIEGDSVPWRPLRAFDDGRQVFIEFPPGVGQDDMPPLFVLGTGGAGELVNYRISGRHIIVDRLFAVAELRLGDRHDARRVRIVRADPDARR
jgi:P-type conjugative transfer protein TrbG